MLANLKRRSCRTKSLTCQQYPSLTLCQPSESMHIKVGGALPVALHSACLPKGHRVEARRGKVLIFTMLSMDTSCSVQLTTA